MIYRGLLIEKINRGVLPFVENRGLVLAEFKLWAQGKRYNLRLLVDRPQGGITVGECAALNKDIQALLDEKKWIGEDYVLEVSSPGIGSLQAKNKEKEVKR
ncbi:MAG: ribosome maturation factor RimP [Candidatus Omnitrophota bacterium]